MDAFEEIASARWNEIDPSPEDILERFRTGGNQAEKVLALNCGKELNVLVAKYVMGHEVVSDCIMGEVEGIRDVDNGTVWSALLEYSEDIEAAQKVVDRMMEEGCMDALVWHTWGNGKYTPAEAICKRAFIRKVLGR